jgi:hypothetical protein
MMSEARLRMKNIQELVIELHDIARNQDDIRTDSRLRRIADDLSLVAKDMSDKGYELSTLEKQEEFAKKRNYPL